MKTAKELRFWWNLSILGILFCLFALTVDTAWSAQHKSSRSRTNNHISFKIKDKLSGPNIVRGAILRRSHRQTSPSEDSYEDVVEYEYEDEVSPTESKVGKNAEEDEDEVPTEKSKKVSEDEQETSTKGGGGGGEPTNGEEGDEYYDTYDENPNGNTNQNGDDDGGKLEEEDEEEDRREKSRPRAEHEDDDADEDSAEREDRLEEERRQEQIREQERLEEERRLEERREQQRRIEAAEEENEEDNEDDLRREEDDARRRQEEAAAEERNNNKVEEEEVAEVEEASPTRHVEEEEEVVEEEIEPEEEEGESHLGQQHVEEVTTTSTLAPAPEEVEEIEYEEEEEETGHTGTGDREFEEDRRNQVETQHENGDDEESHREHVDENLPRVDQLPTESEEGRPQAPIPIEESGREDLERYTTHDRRPGAYGNEFEEEVEEEHPEEVHREHPEENHENRIDEETDVRRRPDETDFEEIDRSHHQQEIHEESEEAENVGEEDELEEEVTQSPREEDEVFTSTTTTTTEQTPTPTPPNEIHHFHHSVENNEIDNSIDEELDPYAQEDLRTTLPPYKENGYEVEEDEDERINQIHKETIINPTESSTNSLDVERTVIHQSPNNNNNLFEEDEDDEEEAHGGFYEGRRFNEENRRTEDEEDEFEETDRNENQHHHQLPHGGVVANLDLSREPEEAEETNHIDEDLRTTTMRTTPSPRTTTTTTTTPRPHRVQYPDSSYENRIDRVDEGKVTSFYDKSGQHHHHRHQHGGGGGQHGSTAQGNNNRQSTLYTHTTNHRQQHGFDYNPKIEYNVNNNRIDEIPSKIECFSGYYLSDDGTECLDVDECAQDVCGVTQICLNTPGSYRCTCNYGFVKDFRNELSCRDINECEIGNGGCSKDCVNTLGSYYCSCGAGAELAKDGRTCLTRPPTTTTTTTTSTTTTRPPTTTTTTSQPIPTLPTYAVTRPTHPIISVVAPDGTRISNCPTPPVPRGSGIAYLYCSRSPVGIHHRHSQLEKRLLQDWAARKNRYNTSERVNSRFRLRRNLKRQLRQTTYSPGSMCELRCKSGFKMKGDYTLHCNATGLWYGTTDGYCQGISKSDEKVITSLPSSETTSPNEIPRLGPSTNDITDIDTSYDKNRHPSFKPSYRPSSIETTTIPSSTTSFRPNFYLPSPINRDRGPLVFTPPPPATRFDSNRDWPGKTKTPTTPPSVTTTTSTTRPYYNYYSPVTPFRPIVIPSTTTTTTLPTTTRNSFIHLTYSYKTPWIKCPDDIKIDLHPGQRLAYVIIPQPQTNVDWWRQVTSEPAWAKGLETEMGPGKQKVTFRARTPAPLNNSAECSFVLEIRDIEPPTIRDCPESFSVRLSPGQSARAVTWVEPHFSDNVRISAIKKSREPGLIMTAGEHVVNYEVSDISNNHAKCTFTIKVLPAPVSDSRFNHQNNLYRKPAGTEGITTSTSTPIKPDIHSQMRNVICHVGKKGRRIVFQSRVVPRGCSEMPADMVEDSAANGPGSSYNTVNTLVQNSAENSATSQISSVSFSTNDHPQSASSFGQAISNGRNANRLVHSTSVVTNGAHGTSSRASSYALSSSRNFDTPLILSADKQVYDEDFVVPTSSGTKTTRIANPWNDNAQNKNHHLEQQQEPRDFVRSGGSSVDRAQIIDHRFSDGTSTNNHRNISSNRNSHSNNNKNNHNRRQSSRDPNQQEQTQEYRKYFRHFDSWDSTVQRQ